MKLNEIRRIVYNETNAKQNVNYYFYFNNSLDHMCAIDSLTQIMTGGAAYMNIQRPARQLLAGEIMRMDKLQMAVIV